MGFSFCICNTAEIHKKMKRKTNIKKEKLIEILRQELHVKKENS